MQSIDQVLNTYEYIKAVDRWIKDTISSFTKINRVVYPAIVFAFNMGLWYSRPNTFIPGNSDTFVIWGIPGYFLLVTIVLACLMSIFAGPLFKLDVYVFYGRILKKLEEILADMEELKSDV